MSRVFKIRMAGKGDIVMQKEDEPKGLLNNVDGNGDVLLIDPFDKKAPHYPLLDNLQGNILKGMIGRTRSIFSCISRLTMQTLRNGLKQK
jgi:hypothetical protein